MKMDISYNNSIVLIYCYGFGVLQVEDQKVFHQQKVAHLMEALLKSRSTLFFLSLPLCFVLSPSSDFVHTVI